MEPISQAVGIADVALRGSMDKGRLVDFHMADIEPSAYEDGIHLKQGQNLKDFKDFYSNLFTLGQWQGKLLRSASIAVSERQNLQELQGLLPRLRDQYYLNGNFITVNNTLDILHQNGFEVVPGSVKIVRSTALLNDWNMSMQVQKVQRSTSSNDGTKFWKGAFFGASLPTLAKVMKLALRRRG